MARAWYKHGDAKGAQLDKANRKAFRKSRLTLNFDELNSLRASMAMTALYQRLDAQNRACYEDIVEYVYAMACMEAGASPEKKLGSKWVDRKLREYDPVTKYVYAHEVERKRARLFESIMADRDSDNRKGIEEDYRRAANLWEKQARQYRISMEDEAALEGYLDSGVEQVRWIAERDERVCKVCRKYDGLVFQIDRVPEKPHYGCRCKLEPVK